MASPTTLNLEQSLLIKNLLDRNVMPMVYLQDPNYAILTQLSTKFGPSESTPTPKFEVPSLGDTSVFSTVTAAPTLSGSDLIVTVSNPDNFREGDIVADANLKSGMLVSKAGSTITLRAVSGSFSTATDFIVGHVAKVLFDSSPNKNSGGKQSLNYTPDLDYGYTAVSRATHSKSRRDRTKTYVQYQNGYWWTSQDTIVLRQFMKEMEFKAAFSERALFNGPNGEHYTTGGLRWSILNNGGTYLPLTSNMTLDDLNSFLTDLGTKDGNASATYAVLCGREFLARFQTLNADYIKYAGTANTLGGVSVTGIDVYKYAFAGVTLDIVVWALLDSPMFRGELSSINGKPRRSYSAYFLNTTPRPTLDGGTVPVMKKYHFNDDEMIIGYLPGMVGLNDSNPSAVKEQVKAAISAQASLITSPIDSVDLHVLSDCGYYFVPESCGLIEAIQ